MEFSVINESSLHNTLKKMYAFENDGETEVKLDGHVYDVFTRENQVIEIQTKNLSKLFNKLKDALDKNHKVKLVHPVVLINTIITYDQNGNVLTKRKSPKRGSIYDIFKELTGIYPLLLNENFELEILEIAMSELRTKMDSPVQSHNNNRHHLKNWVKTGKKLNEINNRIIFKSQNDYLDLLPENTPDEFCAKDINKLLKTTPTLPASASNSGNIILWVYSRMGIISETKKIGKTKYYKKRQLPL